MKAKTKLLIKILARTGTGLLLMVLVWSCGTVPGLHEETTGTYIRIPFVRVLLQDDQKSAQLNADSDFAIECLLGGKQSVFYASNPVTISNRGGRLEVRTHKGGVVQDRLEEVNIIPRGTSNRIHVGTTGYRGMIKLLPTGETLQLINIVYMEDYLRGVVPSEIGDRIEEELEAVKAQAVAARTYAMAHLQQYPGKPYDMKSSIIDQVYEGADVENKLVNTAIDATAGQVLFYNDSYVSAYYHSTCGGMTDDVDDVWDKPEVPYLRAVSDSSACGWSKYFRWSEFFTESQLRGRIEQYLSSDRGRDLRIGRIQDVRVEGRTPGGRVEQLMVRTEYDVFRFKKDRIRWVVGRTSTPDLILPSDRFDVSINRDSQGNFESITFDGSGYGHGVGMCQCGAIGLARKGWKFDTILTLYYSGADVRKLY